jgi:hypothetical protein
VLAAHRGTADAAGIDWKAAIYQHIQTQTEQGAWDLEEGKGHGWNNGRKKGWVKAGIS